MGIIEFFKHLPGFGKEKQVVAVDESRRPVHDRQNNSTVETPLASNTAETPVSVELVVVPLTDRKLLDRFLKLPWYIYRQHHPMPDKPWRGHE